MMIDKPLPASLEAERIVLGSLMSEYVDPHYVLAAISPDDMHLESHRRILTAIAELAEKGEPITRVNVYEQLRTHKWHDACGGLTYLAYLEGDSLPINLDSYLRRIADTSVLRKTISACTKLIQECYAASDSSAHLLQRAQRTLNALSDRAATNGSLQTIDDIVAASGGLDYIVAPDLHAPPIPSPWESLNHLITGWRPGQLIIVGARPSIGKTAFLSQACAHAVTLGKSAALFSLEMSGPELLVRIACAHAGVDGHRLRSGSALPVEREALVRSLSSLSLMRICDAPHASIASLRSSCRRTQSSHPLDLIAVDYVQLMEPSSRKENRVQEITEISRGLKLLARELNVPIIAAAQLNRAPESERRKPTLADLRDSGSLEQDADVVIMLHRSHDPPHNDETEVYVRKQRNGPTGKVVLRFESRYARFVEDTQ